MGKHTCVGTETRQFRGLRHGGWMIYKVLSVRELENKLLAAFVFKDQ